MNWKATLVLFLVVAGMGAWVYFGESKITPHGVTPKVIDDFKTDDVTKVEIKRGKGLAEQIVLEKVDGAWKMTKPVTDRADEGKVREILSPIEFLEGEHTFTGDQAKAKPFEVEQTLSVSRPTDKGGDFTLEIAAPPIAGAGIRLLRVVGRPDVVYEIKKELPEKLAWDAFELRIKDIFSIATPDVGKVKAVLPSKDAGPGAPPRLLELDKGKDRFWYLNGTGGELCETKKVTDLLDKARDLKAKGLVSDAPTDADLSTYGLAPAELELTLTEAKDASPKTETVSIGKKIDPAKGDERYARVAGRPTVYKLDAADLWKEVSRDPVTFRTDSVIALSAGTEGVTAISAKSPTKEWSIKKKDADWAFEVPGKAPGDTEAVKALLKSLAELKIATREEGSEFPPKAGLATPAFTITLNEGDATRVLQVGASAGGDTYYVRRGSEPRYFTAKLGDLVGRLENGTLGLRSKSMMKVLSYDVIGWTLTDGDKVVSKGEKKGNDWDLVPPLDAKNVDSNKITHAFEPFGGDGLKAEALVAEVSSASEAQYGLDKPRTLSITTEAWSSETNAKKKEDHVLLIGRQEGDSLYVEEKGGTAIGKVKSEFLDLLKRGFRKGKDIFTFATHEVVHFTVKDADGKTLLDTDKHKEGVSDEWFLMSSDAAAKPKLVTTDVNDKLLRPWEKIEGVSSEDATDASKKAHGLDKPWRTIEVTTKNPWGEHKDEAVKKTLLVGAPVEGSEHDRWAMESTGTDISQVYDGPIQKLDAFIASPPIAKVEEKKDGVAPVASPTPADVSPIATPTK